MTVRLTETLSPEDQNLQSMPDASPVKWHLAHTSWFFETFLLNVYQPDYRWYDEAYCYLFNSYYNGIGPQYKRARRGLISRPGTAEVLEYRRHVDLGIGRLLNSLPSSRRHEVSGLLELGLNHEQQHQELLLTDLKHALWHNPQFPVYRQTRTTTGQAGPIQWQEFDGGLVRIGDDGSGFAFDNETPRHKVWLQPWRLANRPVTNGEFLEFIEDGGYTDPLLWLSDGWMWREQEGVQMPLYWIRGDAGNWREFTLGGLKNLDRSAPVAHLSYYEAVAYASWAGKRLPTEFEWEAAAQNRPLAGNLLDLEGLHPRAATETGELDQLFGDVWEWTGSGYTPYPGYKPAPGAVGEYNGKFMVNQMVLKGGSCVTPVGHIRSGYRNFFPPTARWQFSGLRLADDIQ